MAGRVLDLERATIVGVKRVMNRYRRTVGIVIEGVFTPTCTAS